jgi:hypothetical protein
MRKFNPIDYKRKNIVDGDMKVCSFVNVWNGNEE